MLEAIRAALADALEEDDRVVVVGEEVGQLGGVFRATQGLQARFGPGRVLDSPLSEAALAGWGIGLATEGLRPVVEIMFVDFITLAMDQIVNLAAKLRYMSGGQFTVPLVVRAPCGAGTHHGPQHSQSLETWFAHVPGLVVAMPSNAADAYWMLRDSIANDNVTVFLEPKALYFKKQTTDLESATRLPEGHARLVREGSDLTVVTAGTMVHRCVAAAEALAARGVSCEIIDVRYLWPMDFESIGRSLERTGRLLVVHEAVQFCGWGAEVAAWASAECFEKLNAPVRRLGAERAPIGFAPVLEDAVIPTTERIGQLMQELSEY